jgi:sugar/nucleoside kinase (ribokinase family)
VSLVVVSGYTSLDTVIVTAELPRPGETAIVEEEVPPPRFGGCAPNVAVRLRRLGVPAALVAWLGDDDEGRAYHAWLEAAGVDLRGLEVGPGRSPQSWLVYNSRGDAVCLFHPSGAEEQRAASCLLDGAAWLAITVGAAELTRSLLDAATGLRVGWNVKADRSAFTPDLVRRLAAADLVCLNRREAAFVGEALELRRPAEPDDLLARGAGVVALTRGSEGALVAWADGEAEIAGEPVAAADATGAGDAFFAGLLAGLCRGLDPDEAGRRGAAAAVEHLLEGASR